MIIEGLWKSDGQEEFHMFVATDDPEFVDGICFIGPREDFASYKAEILQSFRSIEWNQSPGCRPGSRLCRRRTGNR